jgi:ATP diphosphatase
VTRLEAKMRRRHPHLYGDGPAVPWEELKAQERAAADTSDRSEPADSLLDGLASGLDPLSLAQRIQDRVSAVGFDWQDPSGAIAKVREETEEVSELITARPNASAASIEEELGDLLFSVVNTARLVDVHAMVALRRANEKFSRRFRALETLAGERSMDLHAATLADMDELWDEVKASERAAEGPAGESSP